MSCEDEHYSHDHSGSNHDHDHGHDHDHTPPPCTSSSQSLVGRINLPHVKALNLANESEDLSKIFRTYQDRYQLKPTVCSDCDSQLIIHIPFIDGMVKLQSLILRTNGESYCPRTIKVWKNDSSIDFDGAGVRKPTYKFTHPLVGLPDYEDDECPDELIDDTTFVEHSLPRHTFSGVHHLTIFVEDTHQDNDECRIHYIELRGEFTALSRDAVITIYELAPNPADHAKISSQIAYSALQ